MADRKLTPVEVLQRLQGRLQRRIEALQRASQGSPFTMVIEELRVELDYLNRAQKYLEK